MTQPDAGAVDDFEDAAEPSDAADKDAPDPKAEAEKWKALARKHEQAAKANAAAARKLAEIEDRDKSETQRLTEERDALRLERDSIRVEATRARLALRYKLDEDDLDFIGSGTDEEMEARAKRYSERVSAVRKPAGGVDQGVRTTSAPADMNELIRRQAARR